MSSVYAGSLPNNPGNNVNNPTSAGGKLTTPDSCEIEILNNSFRHLYISGSYGDVPMRSFEMSRFNTWYHIPMDPIQPGYCYSYMFLQIATNDGVIYSGYPVAGSILNIQYLAGKAKVAVTKK